MPLVKKEHEHATVNAFLWGLLPDNELILERWGRRFQVASGNAYSLLAHVGEDCAGAVRFVAPDRLHALSGEGTGSVDWLTEKGVATRLRALSDDLSAWRRADDSGQFSLAGAKPKTALLFDGKRWGCSLGANPNDPHSQTGSLGTRATRRERALL